METQLISRVIANTRRQKRVLNLVQIADDIKKLTEILGNTKSVAQTVLLSQSMIGQFLSILNLCPEVKKMVENRAIDSVSSGFYLSKFNHEDQKVLAKMMVANQVSGAELRIILPLRKQFKFLTSSELVQKLQDSSNKKVSVIKFEVEDKTASISEIKDRLLNVVEKENLISVEQSEKFGTIRLTPKGEEQLRQAAKKSKKNLQDYTYTIIY